ncbi:MAG: hypothetical protein K9W44_15660 [Candidatus Lokiarchaeota archaeon]|nr:hypothetical protein [Candidatus Harpocratesius repetitus]
MRISLKFQFELNKFPYCEMNEIDAHKIGLPEGGTIRLFSTNRRWHNYFHVPMRISPTIPEGTIVLPKLFQSLPFSQNKTIKAENAAKFINPGEEYSEYKIDELDLKSQTQLFEEVLSQKMAQESQNLVLHPDVEKALDNLSLFSKNMDNELNQYGNVGKNTTEENKLKQIDDSKIEQPFPDKVLNKEYYKGINKEIHSENIKENRNISEIKTDSLADDFIATSTIKNQNVEFTIESNELVKYKEKDSINLENYPNKISVEQLHLIIPNSQIVRCKIVDRDLNGNILISQELANRLSLFPGAFLGWEDPISRRQGMATIEISKIEVETIIMDKEMFQENQIAEVLVPKLVVFSMEPPIIKVRELTFKPIFNHELIGKVKINFRNANALGVKLGDIVGISKSNTNLTTYAKVQTDFTISNERIEIDPNILWFDFNNKDLLSIQKRPKNVVNIKKLYLLAKINPNSSESYNKITTNIQNRKESIRIFFLNYFIFPRMQVKHPDFDSIFKFKSCSPALGPQEIGKISANSEIEISIEGLVPVDTLILFDLTRSMLARDVEVNKEYKEVRKVENFLSQLSIESPFPMISARSHISRLNTALFFIFLYIIEKISRKIEEHISIVVFKDHEEIISTINQDDWLNSNIYSTSVLVSFIHNLLEQVELESGTFHHIQSILPKSEEIIRKLREKEPTRPIKLIIITDATPDDFPELEKILSNFYQFDKIQVNIFGMGNISLKELVSDFISNKLRYYDINSFSDFIPLYRKLATFND